MDVPRRHCDCIETSPIARYPTSAVLQRRASSTRPGLSGTTMVMSVLTGDTFKTRWRGHKSDFDHREKRGDTELAGYIWDLKDSNIPYTISWDILGRAPTYNPVTKTCRLCTLENFLYFTTPERQASTNGRNYFHPVSTETDISFSPEEKRKSEISRRTGTPHSVSLLL